MAEPIFSHLDGDGRLQMVDVSSKDETRRVARASCLVVTRCDIAALDHRAEGFSILQSARLAGIQAAKRTADVIPLCHPLAISHVTVDIDVDPRGLEVRSEVITNGRTGVEMEALTACTFAALGLVNALIATEPDAHVEDLVVLSKQGGKSGEWGRSIGEPTRRT